MNKIFAISLFVAACQMAFAAPDPNFHIYIAFGQSNMEGQADVIDENKIQNERFKVLASVSCSNMGRTLGNWSVAVPPLFHCNTGLSPADYFGKTLADSLPNVTIGVIPVAVAGSSIKLFDKAQYESYLASAESWMQQKAADYGGNPYGRIIDLAKEAKKVGVIKGILMHQGETDAYNDTWAQTVKKVYGDMLSDLELSADSVPLLVGEVLQDGQCSSANSQIDALPNKIPTAHVVSSKDCSGGSDNLHFDNAGYQLLGKRYAQMMLSLLKNDTEKASSTPYIERISIPGKIEAENYDRGGQGVAFNDLDPENATSVYREDNAGIDSADGNFFYGWTQKGEWLLFSINAESSGEYEFVARVASGSDGASFSLQIDGSEIAQVSIPNTGSYTSFTDVSGKTSKISKGEHLLKLVVDEPYFNVDYILFSANGVEKIAAPGKRKTASSYRIYDMNGKKLGSYFTNSDEEDAVRNLRSKYPQGPYQYRRFTP